MTLYRRGIINALEADLKSGKTLLSNAVSKALNKTQLRTDAKDEKVLAFVEEIFGPYHRYYLATGPLKEDLMPEYEHTFLNLLLDFLKKDEYQEFEHSMHFAKFKDLQAKIIEDMKLNPEKYIPRTV